MTSDYSVDDVLFAYSKAYAVERESGIIDYELPAKLEKLDSALGLNISLFCGVKVSIEKRTDLTPPRTRRNLL